MPTDKKENQIIKGNLKNVLITGATGNVGLEVINHLQKINHSFKIYAGVKNIHKNNEKLAPFDVCPVQFDFTDRDTYSNALRSMDILFLLRPPQISDVEKYFKPLVEACIVEGVKHVVFLSVQGVEKSNVIPHYKIEKLIIESGIPYTFLRPAYFMQNFTTTLRKDLIENSRIYLPAGNAKFTVIDVRDIGAVAAEVIINTSLHINKAYALTNYEKLTFGEMAEMLCQTLGKPIRFKSPTLIQFFLRKKKEHLPTMLILVMTMLHYLPRFQEEPEITHWVEKITGTTPITFEQFTADYKNLLIE